MIVEDDWLLASDLQDQLTELNHHVITVVPSGEQVIDKVQSSMPDIVIMDVSLAGRMKGTEAAAILWEQFHIPIVFLTARFYQATLSEAQSSMPNAFLTKPHSAAQLHSAVQLALSRRAREGASVGPSKRPPDRILRLSCPLARQEL